jgi:hypothetical protein
MIGALSEAHGSKTVALVSESYTILTKTYSKAKDVEACINYRAS